MCGITGGWWPGRSVTLHERLTQALDTMHRRGPDDRGYELYQTATGVTALGHTRLSIIDLSAAGHQPMQSADASVSIVFNGEIYNYRELRAALEPFGHCFVSGSDTEVLLAAWRQWGRECLGRLVGMFAFAVFDRGRATLTCVRDAFGIKPFFYTWEHGCFLFASEVSAIKALKQEPVQLDWQCAYDYLVHADYDNETRSFLDGVLHLLPGHLIELKLSSGTLCEPQRWWTPQITERCDLSFAEAVDQVRECFLTSIRLHLRSDVPLGAALSGGIDSSAVVCAMRHVEPNIPIHTFSYIARGSKFSEEIWVDRVNQYVGAMAHKVVVSGEDLAQDLDAMIMAQGEPFGSTSIYAQYRVYQLARETGITVTLDGQGADEMLAGYNGYPGQRVRSLVERGKFAEAWCFINDWSKWPGRSRLDGAKRVVAELTSGSMHTMLRRLGGINDRPSWINPMPLIERDIIMCHRRKRAGDAEAGRRLVAVLADSLTRRGLPMLLRHGDRNSMNFSVESRVPFLTIEMVELLLSLPESYLVSPIGETKHIFRAAMRGIVPDEILDRRDKIGFETPEREWLLSMSDTVRRWLSADISVSFINQQEMLATFDRIVAGRQAFTWQVWRWINFSRWHMKFLT